jgi:predicted naringenin-chalcone synthase
MLMKTSDRVQIFPLLEDGLERTVRARRAHIAAFQEQPLRFRSPQKKSLEWLAEAHVALGGADPRFIRALLSRYSASPDQIAFRQHELPDFTHRRWKEMRLFSPKGSDTTQKAAFFDETVSSVFERLYPEEAPAPKAIVHVTCTGYNAPSGAQRLVSARDWGQSTQVIHAYHMGCYAAHPALRIAAGQESMDIVHTELCSLHFDPTKHDPAQLIIQSLFGDGCIKYQVTREPSLQTASLEILALHDEILPNSTHVMNWAPSPLGFSMTLSKEVPLVFANALPQFVRRLFGKAGLDFSEEKEMAIFAIHPGGPRIIEMSEQILDLKPNQSAWSRHVLRNYGNMSSATLPHIWHRILKDDLIPNRTLIVSLGAGPGLTLSGAIFRKRNAL